MTVNKYDWGASGSSSDLQKLGGHPISTNVGAAEDGTLRVTIATDDAVPISLAGIENSLDIIDDWDEADRAKVNVIVGQAGISAGAGAVAANTPRTTLASNDPAVTALQIMDDWDESDRCKVNVALNSGVAVDIGAGAVGVGTPRTTLASNDPAVTALQIMDDWDESDRCKVNILSAGTALSVNSGTLDAGTLRVTLASNGPLGSCTNTDDVAIGTTGISTVAKAKTSQRAAVADGDAVQIIANEYGELVLSGHTWATRSNRVEEIDPLDQKYVGETIAVVSNAPVATYNYYIDMGGYTNIGLQWVLSFSAGSTIKIYGSLQDDGTAPASCAYSDLTTALWGVASITASGTNFDTTGTLGLCKYIKIEVVINNANDDYTIYCKRAW